MFDFHITVRELSLISGIGRTKIFELKKHGLLSPPIKWCSPKKIMFNLQKACNEVAIINSLPAPSEDHIKSLSFQILELRNKAQNNH
jgi:hypothetical protein